MVRIWFQEKSLVYPTGKMKMGRSLNETLPNQAIELLGELGLINGNVAMSWIYFARFFYFELVSLPWTQVQRPELQF